MSETEQWFATRNFNGLDKNGNPCDYKGGDVVPLVERWPTFSSLKNIGWITSTKPVIDEEKSEPKDKKEVSKPEPKTPEKDLDEFTCEKCGKSFKSNKALKVHMRYC